MKERPYKNLIAWKEAHKLCLFVYITTKKFPIDERYALASQMCRASYSVPMNIAEGNSRRSAKEKQRFFEIALSSFEELHYQLRLSLDLEYVSQKIFVRTDDAIKRTSFLITKLRTAFF